MSYAPVERTRLDGSALPVRWVQACLCDEHRGLLSALKGATQGKDTPDRAVQLMTEHLAHIEASLCFNQPEPTGVDVLQALARPAPRRQRRADPR